ncbi:MAG: AsmA family protein, partial [bacterium]
LKGSVNFSELNGRWGIKELHVVSSDTELYKLTLDEEAHDSHKIEIITELEIPDPPVFGEAFGIDLSGYAAYKGKGVLTGTRTQLNYKGATSIGRNKNELTLAASMVNGKPTIKGKFSTPNLYLPDIGINTRLVVKEGEVLDPETGELVASEEQVPKGKKVEKNENKIEEAKSKALLGTNENAVTETKEGATPEVKDSDSDTADSQFIFSREPFDFAWLQGFNLELEVHLDDITGVDYVVDKLSAQVNLTDGVLSVSPMRLTFEGGTTDIDLSLDTRAMPTVSLKIFAKDLVLGKAIADLQDVVPVEGKAYLDVDIKSQGRSHHEMAANLSGKTDFGLEDAKIPQVYIEFLSIDVFGWLTRTVTFDDEYTTLHCTIASFSIDQGVANSNLLVADGPEMSIEGNATMDLGQETIDMTLYPSQKKRVTSGSSTIEISGALADPDVDTSTSKVGTAAVVGGALIVPQVVIPVFLAEQLWKRVFSSDESVGCDKIVADYHAKQEEAESPKEPRRHPGR